MTAHEPECGKSWRGGECCGAAGSYEFGGACNSCPERQDCTCRILRAAYQRGYTAGYSDHARAQQHWQDTHGAYRQHGEGENP